MKIVNEAGNFPMIRAILCAVFLVVTVPTFPYIMAKFISGGYW